MFKYFLLIAATFWLRLYWSSYESAAFKKSGNLSRNRKRARLCIPSAFGEL